MSEQKKAVATDYRRGYSYKDVGVLLGIPEEQVGKLANEIMKDPPRFLTAVDIDRVWVKAKPWLVTLKRNDGRMPVDPGIVQDAILKAGGVRVFDRIQWRFATKEEAERAARQQLVIDGYAWVVVSFGSATPWGAGSSIRVEYAESDDSIAGCWPGFPVLD
ncbi:MAG: hypothetical protein ACYTGH_19350 [Planctomycetota bacterium]